MDISSNKTIILTQAQVLGICYDKICSDLKWFINTANDYLNDIYDFLVKNKKIIPKSIIPDEPHCLKDILIEYLLCLNPNIDYEELEEEGMERK